MPRYICKENLRHRQAERNQKNNSSKMRNIPKGTSGFESLSVKVFKALLQIYNYNSKEHLSLNNCFLNEIKSHQATPSTWPAITHLLAQSAPQCHLIQYEASGVHLGEYFHQGSAYPCQLPHSQAPSCGEEHGTTPMTRCEVAQGKHLGLYVVLRISLINISIFMSQSYNSSQRGREERMCINR